MTFEAIERVARLLHEAAVEWYARHPDFSRNPTTWDDVTEVHKDLYRHAARRVLKALGR